MSYKKYSEDVIKLAIQEVREGNSIKSTAKKHNISRPTLQRRLRTDVFVATRMGPPTVFSLDQELVFVRWIKEMANKGFPVTKDTFMFSVAKTAKELNITFGDGSSDPGRKWYEGFMKRHPDVSTRTSQNLTVQRRAATQAEIEKWFQEVQQYVSDNNLREALEDPKRVFNCDETAFYLNPKPGKVLAAKGSKSVYTASGGDEKLNLTVLLTANAAGELAPPMIVYRYVRLPQLIVSAMPPNGPLVGQKMDG
ncbi:tigger transposable element-derived protein 1-like [Diabrotica virgifera virgifera]|uniref:HTH CENPB-type domain-containing protein n=1 Tax=Diabrotica virgifera virgifera TaxID=50390 RepID=A0ABM5JVF9_DIAVI|nr:tigger transposable element-derived protein 1-like [Diabrotica virgifera virgifera]